MELQDFKEEYKIIKKYLPKHYGKYGSSKVFKSNINKIFRLTDKLFKENLEVRFSESKNANLLYKKCWSRPTTIMKILYPKYDEIIHDFTNEIYPIFNFLKFEKPLDFKITNDLESVYNMEHIDFNSCMANKGRYYKKFSGKDNIHIAYFFREGEEDSGIVGRSIIWENRFFEAPYSINNHFDFRVGLELYKKGFIPLGSSKKEKVSIDLGERFGDLPFMDTFWYYSKDLKILCTPDYWTKKSRQICNKTGIHPEYYQLESTVGIHRGPYRLS